MNNKKKMVWIVPLLLTLANCQGFLSQYQRPSSITTGGVVAGVVATKAVEKVKEIAEFVPDLKLEQLEVCNKSVSYPDQFRCILVNCDPENKENCVRYVLEEEAYADVENRTALVVKTRGWAKFITPFETYCKSDKVDCSQDYEDYKEIDKVYLVGSE